MNEPVNLTVAGMAITAIGGAVAAGYTDGTVGAVCMAALAGLSLIGRYGVKIAETLRGK